jgi:hypothetical protein
MTQSGSEWKDVQGVHCLVFHFPEHLGAELGAELAAEMIKSVEVAGEQVIMIWDATIMTGYDREAREAWQTSLKRVRHLLARIHLVTRSSTIRLGATAISLFTGYNIKTWPTMEAVRLK